MNYRFTYDLDTVVEAILYIASRVDIANLHRVFKLMYFADKYHLEHYGQLIFGDQYIAMRDGPVPSHTYNTLRILRGEDVRPYAYIDQETRSALLGDLEVVDSKIISPKREANLEFLSETEIESLEYAIKKYGNKSYGHLRKKSHDDSWNSADENDYIDLETLTLGMKNRDELLDYLALND